MKDRDEWFYGAVDLHLYHDNVNIFLLILIYILTVSLSSGQIYTAEIKQEKQQIPF